MALGDIQGNTYGIDIYIQINYCFNVIDDYDYRSAARLLDHRNYLTASSTVASLPCAS